MELFNLIDLSSSAGDLSANSVVNLLTIMETDNRNLIRSHFPEAHYRRAPKSENKIMSQSNPGERF